MNKFWMNRITEDSGETHLRLKAASYVDTRILRVILDHQHDAGADRSGKFEAQMNHYGGIASRKIRERLTCGLIASYVDTRILSAILDHQHDAGADRFGEFEIEMTR